MSTTQEPPRPVHPDTHSQWRKRPTRLAAAVARHPAKRLKYSPAAPSSTTAREKSNSQTPASAQASRPSASTPHEQAAEEWFEDTNEHPREASFIDDDPPYYLDNHSPDQRRARPTRSETSLHSVSNIGPTAPTRSLLAQMNADITTSEDYRSVIDDLTIQNKKLKKKLKRFENLHCSHLQEEKLFEVRIHGLAAGRKHELEETLRSFASSVDEDSPHRPLPVNGYPSIRLKPTPLLYKPSSSTTSASKPLLDSAYASMSGQTGAASHSHPAEPNIHDTALQAKRPNSNSHLHDLSQVVAPRVCVAMSDRLKSKTIIRRLEQLFTGKAAPSRQHGQFLQQQEVSQSASLANGQRESQEGTREAHILLADAELQVDSMEDVRARVSNGGSHPQSLQASGDGSPHSPEQRPTRPLDLDPCRAQDPTDNIEYIRHLGLMSTTEDIKTSSASQDGWVYLNLLMSMAQLHTLNATPDYVRKAVDEFSSKLVLSADHTKVRWLGSGAGSRISSDDDDDDDDDSSIQRLYGQPSGSNMGPFSRGEGQEELPARAVAADGSSTLPDTGAKRRPIELNDVGAGASEIQYRPLFFHTAVSNEDVSDTESDSIDSFDSRNFTALAGIKSGATTLQDRVTRLQGQRRKDGPMIFYNRAKFCTDLGGDLDAARQKQYTYRRFIRYPIGGLDHQACGSGKSDAESCEHDVNEQLSHQDLDMDCTSSALDLDDLKSVISDHASSKSTPSLPMQMEASGLGGIQPEDNFVVRVQVRHKNKKAVDRNLSLNAAELIRKVMHRIPKSSLDVFDKPAEIAQSSAREALVQGEIISAVKTDMNPSALPPASYVCLPFSSSGSDDGESECGGKESNIALARNADRADCLDMRDESKSVQDSRAALQGRVISRYSSPTTPSKDSDDDASDDTSIDLLAHARGLDPETIAAREREFESNTGDLAEVPAGSSAATVGGGASGRSSGGCGEEDSDDINSMSVDGDESI